MKRIAVLACSWGALWLLMWVIALGAIAWFDPGRGDFEQDIGMFLFIFGPMGLLTGLVFAILVARLGRAPRPTLMHAAGLGILATALVQILYLGHGDMGLLKNIQMALMFSVVGGVVTIALWSIARPWWRPA